ncbi:MAG: ABC transporter ATP-binding protein [Armatimonadota bacterium]|nr:ABC transporter ATP-binding protein [Armatimonadota bacterium]MDR7450822.1 ABC transporter ATP-binding protein [Armatimonadota bacterium]MDR7465743.1 ABC transporter ATP-binding protein [Armatimonadota bacterium]MDR7493651.1 ABC transporter ATP-binding protein [Armatimonadota bacterium]MDR7499100.1 ABC transporter ATP-binding protein [Armatimonadota bacterium]
MSVLLRLANVETAYYGRLTVLRGISLEVPEGRIVALLGGNGAGKTTLLRTIMGLIPDQPEKGLVEFAGRRLNGLDPEDIAALGIGYVLEGRGIFPELTVEENLRLGGYRRRDGALREDLEYVHGLFPVLRERRGQLAGTLSGGEQQMLAIGRALLMRPRLLMLDEPSLGLAPLLVREIFRTIAAINALGTTILLVEQNAHMALSIAHYGYVLESGRLVLEGTAQDLAQNPNVQELYLGVSREPSIKGWKRYKIRRRWA